MFKNRKEIKDYLNSKYPLLEYIGGYTGCDGKLVLRCRVCNDEFEFTSQILRPSRKYKIRCKECNRRRKEYENEQKKLNKEKEKSVKKQQKQIEIDLKRERKLSNKVCNECGIVFNATRSNQMYCCDKCKKKHNNKRKEITRRHKIKENGKIDWSITLTKLVKRDKGKCYICGDMVNMTLDSNDEYYGSIDHVIPISKGGTHTWGNVKLAHRHCNSVKNNKTYYAENTGQYKLII